VSVTEPSDTGNAGMAKETGRCRLALRPHLAVWLVVWLVCLLVGGYVVVVVTPIFTCFV
jgi:hypothetical protein